MRASAIVVRTYLWPISESAHSALACSNPTRLISLSMDAAKPGKTKPSLRPDALQAMRRLSNTTTDHPRRAISRAAVSPARPAPITQTSTSRSKVSGPRADAGTMVAVYQVGTEDARSDGTIDSPCEFGIFAIFPHLYPPRQKPPPRLRGYPVVSFLANAAIAASRISASPCVRGCGLWWVSRLANDQQQQPQALPNTDQAKAA